MVYYILVKSKGSKFWMAAIPLKKGVRFKTAKGIARERLSKKVVWKVVDGGAVRNEIKKLVPAQPKRAKQKKSKRTRRK